MMCKEQIFVLINKFRHSMQWIDKCLVKKIMKINRDPKIKTFSSCCGHGKVKKTILIRPVDNKYCFEYFTKQLLINRYNNGQIRKRYYLFNEELEVYELDKSLFI